MSKLLERMHAFEAYSWRVFRRLLVVFGISVMVALVFQ